MLVQKEFSAMNDLTTFEAFTMQTSYKIYNELKQCSDEGNENPFENIQQKYFFRIEEKEIIPILKELINITEEIIEPTYEIKEKRKERVLNPLTGRPILFTGDLCKSLVEKGVLDENGNAVIEQEVQKIISPKSRKPVTVGLKAYKELFENGWLDETGKILKVKHPTQKEETIKVGTKLFHKFVKEGFFEEDGTPINTLKRKK